jgi:hypothetical protein
MIRRLRLGNLSTLFRDRYRGFEFPDDDAGREDLRELLLPVSIGPHADIRMPSVIAAWARWMQPQEATELIDRINMMPMRRRMPTAKQLGKRQNVTASLRHRLKLWTIRPCDISLGELRRQRRREAARERMRRLRQLQGRKPRAEWLATNSISRTKPWEKAGFKTRRTWERHGKPMSQVCSHLKLNKKAANTPATQGQAEAPQKGSGERTPVSRPSKTTKPRKAQSKKGVLLTWQLPCSDVGEHTCDTTGPVPNDWRRNAKTPEEAL